MADAEDDKENMPGLDDTDAQDLQASTFQYGVVKTQQQLMMKNPLMNGDLYDEGSIDEEELDRNHNGIPDDEEDLVGTFLTGTVKDMVDALHDADWNFDQIDKVVSPHDQDITDPTSKYNHALKYVQERAKTDPEAQALLDNYNKTTDAVKSAIENARQSQSPDSFLDLEIAELDRSLAKSEIAKYEAAANGHSDELDRAHRWHDGAQATRDQLAKIRELPPDQQQAALEKLAQDNQKSRVAHEWARFKTGDLSKWTKENNSHIDGDSPDYPNSPDYRGSNNYQSGGARNNASPSGSPSYLSSSFGNWAMPWSSSQPAAKPVAHENKTDNSWSLTSLFGSLAMPWSTSSAPAAKPAVDTKKQDDSWSLTSIFSNWSWPWSGASKASTPSSDAKKQTTAPTTSGP
ncbi:MAG TPA: hypothetical protein VL625_03865 [Patescibacteria group bacterium]|nr:hypothetical protein [Patescibacteria group bacterium]